MINSRPNNINQIMIKQKNHKENINEYYITEKSISILSIVFGSRDVIIRATPTLYLVVIIASSRFKNVCVATRRSPSTGIPHSYK